MVNQITFVKGVRIDQKKLRDFLKTIDWDEYEITEGPDKGKWKSPVNGDIFETKAQMYGQLGAYLRTPAPKDPREPTRAGYVRAIRRGLEPTKEQREAHRRYAREHRRKKRSNLMESSGIDGDGHPTEQVKIPAMSWD